MTGADRCKLMVDKAEQVLLTIGKQRLDDPIDAQLRLSLRAMEQTGICDVEALPPFLRQLAENLLLMSTIGVPLQLGPSFTKLAFLCIYYTAQHYEDAIESGRIADGQALLRIRITDREMKDLQEMLASVRSREVTTIHEDRDRDLGARADEVQEGVEDRASTGEDPQRDPPAQGSSS